MWSALLAIDQHNRRQINISIHNGLLPSNNNNNNNNNTKSNSTSTSNSTITSNSNSYCEDASASSDFDASPSTTKSTASRPLIARTLSSSTRSTNNSTSTLGSESEYISVAICSGIWMGETDNYKSGAKDMFR